MNKNENLRLYLKYAITTLCSFIIFRSSEIIDAVFTGRYVSSSSLASVAIVSPFRNFIEAITYMITTGSIVSIGKLLGEEKQQKANDLFTKISLLLVSLGVLFSIFGIIFSKKIIYFLGGNDKLLKDAQTYLIIYLLFFIFRSLEHFVSAFIRLTGRPTIIPFFSLANTILNLILKWIFIIKKNMQITGVILSSSLSVTIIAFAYLIAFFSNKDNKLKLIKLDNREVKEIGRILYNGLSVFIIFISIAVYSYCLNKIIIKQIGTDGITAYAPLSYTLFITASFIISFSVAATPLISINYGKKDYYKIRKFLQYAFIGAMVSCYTILTIIFINPNLIINFFLKKEEVGHIYDLTLSWLKITKFEILTIFIPIIFNDFLSAIQKATMSLILSILNVLVIPLGTLICFSALFGPKGIFLSLPISDVISTILVVSIIYINRKNYLYGEEGK